MTPYELSILLDVYVGTPIKATPDAPIYSGTIDHFVATEYLLPYRDDVRPMGLEYAPTRKLCVLMDYILDAPEPVWKMP